LKWLVMKNERDLERHADRLEAAETALEDLQASVGVGREEESRWKRREQALRTWTRQRVEELGQAHGAVINRLSTQVSEEERVK